MIGTVGKRRECWQGRTLLSAATQTFPPPCGRHQWLGRQVQMSPALKLGITSFNYTSTQTNESSNLHWQVAFFFLLNGTHSQLCSSICRHNNSSATSRWCPGPPPGGSSSSPPPSPLRRPPATKGRHRWGASRPAFFPSPRSGPGSGAEWVAAGEGGEEVVCARVEWRPLVVNANGRFPPWGERLRRWGGDSRASLLAGFPLGSLPQPKGLSYVRHPCGARRPQRLVPASR